jgi:hypothetical protein
MYTYKGHWVPGIALRVAGNMTDTQFGRSMSMFNLLMGLTRDQYEYSTLDILEPHHANAKKRSI